MQIVETVSHQVNEHKYMRIPIKLTTYRAVQDTEQPVVVVGLTSQGQCRFILVSGKRRFHRGYRNSWIRISYSRDEEDSSYWSWWKETQRLTITDHCIDFHHIAKDRDVDVSIFQVAIMDKSGFNTSTITL